MFGNIINNAQIRKLRDDKELTISPFRDKRLKLAHYALSPAGVLWAGAMSAKANASFSLNTILNRTTNIFFNQANTQSSKSRNL